MSLHGKMAVYVTGSKKRMFFKNNLSQAAFFKCSCLKRSTCCITPEFLDCTR